MSGSNQNPLDRLLNFNTVFIRNHRSDAIRHLSSKSLDSLLKDMQEFVNLARESIASGELDPVTAKMVKRMLDAAGSIHSSSWDKVPKHDVMDALTNIQNGKSHFYKRPGYDFNGLVTSNSRELVLQPTSYISADFDGLLRRFTQTKNLLNERFNTQLKQKSTSDLNSMRRINEDLASLGRQATGIYIEADTLEKKIPVELAESIVADLNDMEDLYTRLYKKNNKGKGEEYYPVLNDINIAQTNMNGVIDFHRANEAKQHAKIHGDFSAYGPEIE